MTAGIYSPFRLEKRLMRQIRQGMKSPLDAIQLSEEIGYLVSRIAWRLVNNGIMEDPSSSKTASDRFTVARSLIHDEMLENAIERFKSRRVKA